MYCVMRASVPSLYNVYRRYIQWNLPKTDTIGTERCVHFMEGVLYWEVFAIYRSLCLRLLIVKHNIIATIDIVTDIIIVLVVM